MFSLEYKVLSYLLFYPSVEFLASLEEVYAEVKNADIKPKVKANFLAFIDTIKDQDLYDLQSYYVGSFDNNPSLSLYLFDHIMGDSKERGVAMVDLKQEYLDNNFDIRGNELPDYLPVFLEFISQLSQDKIIELVNPLAELFNELCLRHRKVNSYYALLFENLVLLQGKEIQEKEVKVLTAEEINEMWKEQEVKFANNNNSIK